MFLVSSLVLQLRGLDYRVGLSLPATRWNLLVVLLLKVYVKLVSCTLHLNRFDILLL